LHFDDWVVVGVPGCCPICFSESPSSFVPLSFPADFSLRLYTVFTPGLFSRHLFFLGRCFEERRPLWALRFSVLFLFPRIFRSRYGVPRFPFSPGFFPPPSFPELLILAQSNFIRAPREIPADVTFHCADFPLVFIMVPGRRPRFDFFFWQWFLRHFFPFWFGAFTGFRIQPRSLWISKFFPPFSQGPKFSYPL